MCVCVCVCVCAKKSLHQTCMVAHIDRNIDGRSGGKYNFTRVILLDSKLYVGLNPLDVSVTTLPYQLHQSVHKRSKTYLYMESNQ